MSTSMLHLLSLIILLFTASSQQLCVRNTPITCSKYWDGVWNVSGTHKSKNYYSISVPGNTLYLFYDDSCYDQSIFATCWCFSTAKYSSCSIWGDAYNTTTPDQVTEWFGNDFETDNNTLFTVTQSKNPGTCLNITDVGDCWHQIGTDTANFGGHYRPQNNKIWWNQHQYKAKKDQYGVVYYTYDLYIDTANGNCDRSLLEDFNVDYCWCLSYYAADAGGNCQYQSPAESYNSKPNTNAWYGFGGVNLTAIKFKSCDSDNNSNGSNHKYYALFALLIIPIVGIPLCCCLCRKKNQQKLNNNNIIVAQPYQPMPQGEPQQNFQNNQNQQPYGDVQYFEGQKNTANQTNEAI